MKCKYLFRSSLLITVISLFYTSSLFAQAGSSYYLKGSINNLSVSKVFVFHYSDILKTGVTDSSVVKEGKFIVTGSIATPAFAIVQLNNSRKVNDSIWIIFIEPGPMEITLQTHPFKVLNMTGSPSFNSYDSLELVKEKITTRHKKMIDLYRVSSSEGRDSLAPQMNLYIEEKKKHDFDFFFTSPNSIVTSYLLQRYYRKVSIDTLEKLYGMMNEKNQKSVYGMGLSGFISKENTLQVGKPAPLFSAITVDNKPVDLAAFKGNYVLLDFWAHWCVPCRKSFPELINYHDKYSKRGLKIIGIASDDFEVDKWEEAIMKDKISILYNILDGKRKDKTGKIDLSTAISRKYNVGYLPTKILVDKSGKIIGRFVGEKDEQLSGMLANIFENENL